MLLVVVLVLLMQQLLSCTDRLADTRKALESVYDDLLSLDLDDTDPMFTLHSKLDRLHFDCSLKAKKIRSSIAPSTPGPAKSAMEGKGVKLPKLDVPTFDGDILNWNQFWEQFCVSVDRRMNLSDAEKLVYLQQAVKKGSARSTIDGLSQTGDNYKETLNCLKSRYDRPRLIYRTHVQKIVDTPLKDGNGKELRRLRDTIQQHLRALQSMDGDPASSFLTSIIKFKLDTGTMFEWQRHSQTKKTTPHYGDLLNFIDLRAQASETATSAPSRRQNKTDHHNGMKLHSRNVTSFATQADSKNHCILCESDRHPLYLCPKFKSMSHADKLATTKDKNLCRNCLNGGHIAKQCKSLHRCKKCQRSHHTLLHMEDQENTGLQVASNAAVRLKSSSLLMTCRILVTSPNGSSTEARALLDNASSASFITQHLAQSLNLPSSRQSIHVSGIAGVSPGGPAQTVASLQISPIVSVSEKINLSAIVVPKVTCDLPLSTVPFDPNWKHLTGLSLADPDFGKPGKIDLLGVDIFVDVLLNGRRTGPSGSPVALETRLGWVLSGGSGTHDLMSHHIASLHTSTLSSGDDLIRRFWEVEESPSSPLALSMDEKYVLDHFE